MRNWWESKTKLPDVVNEFAVGVRNLFRWSPEFIPLESGIYSVGVRNLFRWSPEFIPFQGAE